jgi:hypothetical protein
MYPAGYSFGGGPVDAWFDAFWCHHQTVSCDMLVSWELEPQLKFPSHCIKRLGSGRIGPVFPFVHSL